MNKWAQVELSDEYFQSLGRHAVPLDHRAVGILASSSMALDVYVWLAQRLHRVPPSRPQLITWLTLHEQFGQGFARVRDFRRRFLQTLHHVQAAYPHARLIASEVGLTLEHSPPPVSHRHTVLFPKASSHAADPSHDKLVAPSIATQPTGTAVKDGAGRGDETPDKPLNSCTTETVS